jgi:hypothetical protein
VCILCKAYEHAEEVRCPECETVLRVRPGDEHGRWNADALWRCSKCGALVRNEQFEDATKEKA